MSERKFEVHSPHEAHLEHAAHHEPDSMAGQLAVVTAILATVGAMFSYMEGASLADAGLLKNEAAIRKTEAADQWGYYQAEGSKQNLFELGFELVDESRKPFFDKEAKRHGAKKADIMTKAQSLDKESEEFSQKSETRMHEHHRWAQATTVLQIAIAMAAITLLTKKVWLEKAVFGLSAVGFVIGALAWFHI